MMTLRCVVFACVLLAVCCAAQNSPKLVDRGNLQGELASWDSANAKYIPQRKGWVDVRDCNAVGDGAADDTTPLQCAVARAGIGGRIYVPAGKYKITTPVRLLSGQTLECASGDLGGAGIGAVFYPTGEIWGFDNPNADSAAPGTNIRQGTVINCTWDISKDPVALGGLHVKGISGFAWFHVRVVTNNNSGNAVVLDGSNWANNGGCYNNEFFGLRAYDLSHGQHIGKGIVITGDETSGSGCNENHFYGGSANRFLVPIWIDAGNGNQFFGFDAENWTRYCIYLGTNASGSASAVRNMLHGTRCESTAAELEPGAIGTYITDGAVENVLDHTQNSGKYIYTVDHAKVPASNDIQGQNFDPAGVAGSGPITYVLGSRYGTVFGLNTAPDMTHGYTLDVNGKIHSNRGIIAGKVGSQPPEGGIYASSDIVSYANVDATNSLTFGWGPGKSHGTWAAPRAAYSGARVFSPVDADGAVPVTVAVPAHQTDRCMPGSIAEDGNYFYWCHTSGDWKRVPWGAEGW